jgi:protein-tyrosine phosphatase
MAEAILQAELPARAISSAGINALVGMPPAEHACEVMTQLGLSIDRHRARQFTRQLLVDADLILVMDGHQRRFIEVNFSVCKGRVYRLGEFGDFDITDPYRQSKSAFEHCVSTIEMGLSEWVKRLRSIR